MHKGTCFCLIPGGGQRGSRKGQRRIWPPVTGCSLGWAAGGVSICTEQIFFPPFSCVRGFAILNRKWEKPADGMGRKAAAHCTHCGGLPNQQPHSKQGFCFFNCTAAVFTATQCVPTALHTSQDKEGLGSSTQRGLEGGPG